MCNFHCVKTQKVPFAMLNLHLIGIGNLVSVVNMLCLFFEAAFRGENVLRLCSENPMVIFGNRLEMFCCFKRDTVPNTSFFNE